jgi:hypothetical protein
MSDWSKIVKAHTVKGKSLKDALKEASKSNKILKRDGKVVVNGVTIVSSGGKGGVSRAGSHKRGKVGGQGEGVEDEEGEEGEELEGGGVADNATLVQSGGEDGVEGLTLEGPASTGKSGGDVPGVSSPFTDSLALVGGKRRRSARRSASKAGRRRSVKRSASRSRSQSRSRSASKRRSASKAGRRTKRSAKK